jgi:hypothetical protein
MPMRNTIAGMMLMVIKASFQFTTSAMIYAEKKRERAVNSVYNFSAMP